MQLKHWLLVAVSAPLGAALGGAAGWVGVGLLLIRSGRGGHADLGIVWLTGVLGLVVGAVAAPLSMLRVLRRRTRSSAEH